MNASSKVKLKSKGQQQGPITRLISPNELGLKLKPFVFLDLFETPETASVSGGFPWHPHSGIATVSIITQGEGWTQETDQVKHVLHTDDVEWVMSGKGVWHTGGANSEGRTQGVQLWLALPPQLENSEATSSYIAADKFHNFGPARVIVGPYQGVSSPLAALEDMTILDVNLAVQERWSFVRPSDQEVCWMSVIEGEAVINDQEIIAKAELVVLDKGAKEVTIEASTKTRFIIACAKPHRYDLVTGPYSVHTNKASLESGQKHISELAQQMRYSGIL